MGNGEERVENTRDIGVAASDPVNDLDPVVRFFGVEGIGLACVENGAERVVLRAVNDTLGGCDHFDRIFLREALQNFLSCPGLAECKTGCVLRAEEDIYIGKDLLDAFPCFVSGPEIAAEVYVK